MKKRKTNAIQYVVMFGYNRESTNTVGYLKIHQHGHGDMGIYSIVDDADDATRFVRGLQDNALDFMNSEDELSAWRFHFVDVAR